MSPRHIAKFVCAVRGLSIIASQETTRRLTKRSLGWASTTRWQRATRGTNLKAAASTCGSPEYTGTPIVFIFRLRLQYCKPCPFTCNSYCGEPVTAKKIFRDAPRSHTQPLLPPYPFRKSTRPPVCGESNCTETCTAVPQKCGCASLSNHAASAASLKRLLADPTGKGAPGSHLKNTHSNSKGP